MMLQIKERSGTVKIEDVQTLEDVRLYLARRDARFDAWQEQQRKDNIRTENRMSTLDTEVRAVKSKVVWATGAASVVMSFIGSAIAIVIAVWKMG